VGNNLRTTKHKSICPVIARPARMNDMIIRVQKARNHPFVIMDKRPLEDARLSFKAKGILAYLLSRPDDWVVRIADLCNHATDGPTAVRAAMNELASLGYAILRSIKEKDSGKMNGREWVIFENPNESKGEPTLRFSERRENPNSENPHLTNNEALLIKRPTKETGAVAPAASSEAANEDPEQARKAEHSAFMALWHEAFQIQFGRPYVFQGGVDGKPLKTVLAASKMQAKDLMSIATKAWSKSGRGYFYCEAAVTIKYFCEHINQILSELEKRKPGDLPAPRIKAKSPPPGLLPVSDQPTPGYDKDGNEISMAEWERLYPLWDYYEVDTLEPCAVRPNVGNIKI